MNGYYKDKQQTGTSGQDVSAAVSKKGVYNERKVIIYFRISNRGTSR